MIYKFVHQLRVGDCISFIDDTDSFGPFPKWKMATVLYKDDHVEKLVCMRLLLLVDGAVRQRDMHTHKQCLLLD